jgi:glycerophosphoryl diester phosphodiesterase
MLASKVSQFVVAGTLALTANQVHAADKLEARAVLPADTFAPGPTSGRQLGAAAINGVVPPFLNRQPVQGFSAVLNNYDGTYLVMCDNGYGNLENSYDFELRVYRIRPDFRTKSGGSGQIQLLSSFGLRDPDKKIPWTITNFFTSERVLTGADFDIESMQRTADGTLWFGDEFGPFLLHTDATGKLLETPIWLPDFEKPGLEVRSPQNPKSEEASAVRIMNAMRARGERLGSTKNPVFSPWDPMLDDGNASTFIDNRSTPPAGSGLQPASSDIFNVASIQSAGYPVVAYTVNDKARMLELMKLGVKGLISDRPDVLHAAVKEFEKRQVSASERTDRRHEVRRAGPPGRPQPSPREYSSGDGSRSGQSHDNARVGHGHHERWSTDA